MSDINSNGYPVRGWLNGLIEGSATIDETEEVLNGFIELAAKKCYAEGVVDGIKRVQRNEKGSVGRVNNVLDRL